MGQDLTCSGWQNPGDRSEELTALGMGSGQGQELLVPEQGLVPPSSVSHLTSTHVVEPACLCVWM